MALENEIATLEQFRDNTNIMDAIFETRRENVLLEAELAETQQSLTFLSDMKHRLDDHVRREKERLAAEKKEKGEALLRGLLEELKKPAVQQAILQKCLVDLRKIPNTVASAQP